MTLLIEGFCDPATGTVSYVLADRTGGVAAIIDPVLDYDPKSGRVQTTSADRLIDYVREQHLTVRWLLETHVHADHLSAAHYLREKVGGSIAISEKIIGVQQIFRRVFNLEHTFAPDCSQFDHLLTDGELLELGGLTVQALQVPGHTPADMAFRVADAIFLGDTLFMPDVGTARCDFPGGMHSSFIIPSAGSSVTRRKPVYTCVTTIHRQDGVHGGRAVLPNSGWPIFMFMMEMI